jgi:dipeptidase E
MHPRRGAALPGWAFARLPVHQRNNLQPDVRIGLEVVGSARAHRLSSVKPEDWIPAVQHTDALLVWGGSPLYLCYWMRQSGLADLLPSLRPETVYVGTSGGSMVATPDVGGATYDESEPLTGSDKALGAR